MYQFHPAILAVNRQINLEASQTMRGNFFVRVMLDFQFDTNSLPVVAKEDLACRVTYPAIDVSILDMTHYHLNADTRSFMFAGDDMSTFCRILSRKYPFPGSVWIAITGVAQTTIVLKFLEPFRRIYGMASVRITGLTEDAYRSDLIMRMLEQAPDGDTALQEIQIATEEGNQAASIHEYSTAVSRFRKAFDYTDDYWKIYEKADVIVESGKFKGQRLTVSFAQTLLILAIKLAMTTAKLQFGGCMQKFHWIKNGSRRFDERLGRSGGVQGNRMSEILARQKLIRIEWETLQHVKAFWKSYGHEIEVFRAEFDVGRIGQTWREGAECRLAWS